MTRWGTASRGLVGGQIDWHTACELLKAGQYEQAAELLGQAQAASEGAGDASLAQILAAARRISLACSQVRTEGEWYQQAHQEADQREHDLRQQLQAILDLVSGREMLDTGENKVAPSAPMAEPSLSARDVPESSERVSLWQRVQSLLGRGSDPRLTKGETPVLSAKGPTPVSAERAETPVAVPIEKQQQEAAPSLVVYCLGPFRVFQDDQPVEEWPSSKGKAIFKYLVAHRERPIAKEVLMELFWPGAQPDAARNNLNVAIYGLRQALRKDLPFFSHVLYQDDCYLLSPELKIWLDYEAFTAHFSAARALERRGDLASAIREYRAAEVLYEGEFLEEDRYEDWLMPQRQRLREDYLTLLDRLSRYYYDQDDGDGCVSVCRKMLAVDPCREEAHRRLMRCYSRQGQPYLALRQYHLCVAALKEDLDVPPSQATVSLYEHIRQALRK